MVMQMNLHNITPVFKAFFWMSIRGVNWRTIGTHVYELTGLPYPENVEPNGRRAAWAHDPWAAPSIELFRNGYVRPLCGYVTRSRRPATEMSYGTGRCAGCIVAASERGIQQVYSLMNREPVTGMIADEHAQQHRRWRQEQMETTVAREPRNPWVDTTTATWATTTTTNTVIR